MEKDLKAIIKEAAERYGLEYNEEQTVPTFEDYDGKIQKVTLETLKIISGIDRITSGWKESSEIESVLWSNKESYHYAVHKEKEYSVSNDNDRKNVA